MSITVESDDDEATISIQGRFDHDCMSAFRTAWRSARPDVGRLNIDLRETEFMDSSALGLLLELRRYFPVESADICINHCPPNIRKILMVSRFDKKFQIN